ncbi:hypothetical protein ACWF95_34030 [Streptomyces vinaceus]
MTPLDPTADPEGTATVTVTVTDPVTGEQHQARVQPGRAHDR